MLASFNVHLHVASLARLVAEGEIRSPYDSEHFSFTCVQRWFDDRHADIKYSKTDLSLSDFDIDMRLAVVFIFLYFFLSMYAFDGLWRKKCGANE